LYVISLFKLEWLFLKPCLGMVQSSIIDIINGIFVLPHRKCHKHIKL
jgi:hypothetical protein